jgi:multidrug resistance efflux pump
LSTITVHQQEESKAAAMRWLVDGAQAQVERAAWCARWSAGRSTLELRRDLLTRIEGLYDLTDAATLEVVQARIALNEHRTSIAQMISDAPWFRDADARAEAARAHRARSLELLSARRAVQAEVRSLRARIASLRHEIQRAEVRAIESGYVTEAWTPVGSLVLEGDPILAVRPRSSLIVDTLIGALHLPDVDVHGAVSVRVRRGGLRPDLATVGRVSEIGSAVTTRDGRRGVPVRIQLPEEHELIPGSTVIVRFR